MSTQPARRVRAGRRSSTRAATSTTSSQSRLSRFAHRMGLRPSTPGMVPGYRGAGANNWIGGLAAVTVGMTIVLGDLLDGPQVRLVGLLAIVPLIAANFLRPAPTIVTGLVFSTGMTVLVGMSIQTVDPQAQTVRVLATVVVSWFAGGVSFYRCQNAVRTEKLAAVASAVQHAVLEPLPARLGPVRMAAAYRSADDESTVGGDFYAAVQTSSRCTRGLSADDVARVGALDPEVRILLGDVRGKGLQAVRLTNRIVGGFRHIAGRVSDEEAMRQLDEVVSAAGGHEDFATAVMLVVRNGQRPGQVEVTSYNAGHPPLLLVRRDPQVHVVEVGGLDVDHISPPLGLGATPEPKRVSMRHGDLLLMYTDGVSETRRRGEFFPLSEALSAVSRDCDEPVEVVTRLGQRIVAWADRPLSDDIAMLALTPA